MWEKIRVIFTIPGAAAENSADDAVSGDLPRRLADSAADCRRGVDEERSSAVQRWVQLCFSQAAVFSASQLGQATIFGLGIMPYISASIIFQLAGQRVGSAGTAAEGRRKRPQENQRIHSLRHRGDLHRAKLVVTWLG